MLYQHAKHAGNVGDVIKHFLHVQLLEYFQQQNKPVVYLESHAGSGVYKLSNTQNAKYQNGIGKLWHLSQQTNNNIPSCLRTYLKQVIDLNQSNNFFQDLKFYPGSPLLAQKLLTKNSSFKLFELQDSIFEKLEENVEYDSRVKCFNECGFKGVLKQKVDQEQTIYLMIDPPYEKDNEYQQAITTLISFHQHNPKATIALWYPVINSNKTKYLEQKILASEIKSCDLFEIDTNPTKENTMTGAGLLIVNTPSSLFTKLEHGFANLEMLLSAKLECNNLTQTSNGVCRCVRLIS